MDLSSPLKIGKTDDNHIGPSLSILINEKYRSESAKQINEFYNYFENARELVQWLSERPKGAHTETIIRGTSDRICVVIPTKSSTKGKKPQAVLNKDCLRIAMAV